MKKAYETYMAQYYTLDTAIGALHTLNIANKNFS